MGPRLPITNPFLWEIGHVTWFIEKWILRHIAGRDPVRPDGDDLFDSIAIEHDVRWDLPLPSRADMVSYMNEVRNRVLDELDRDRIGNDLIYFVKLSVFHADMHTEAFTYTRQTLSYPAPRFSDTVETGSAPPLSSSLRSRQSAVGSRQYAVEKRRHGFLRTADCRLRFFLRRPSLGPSRRGHGRRHRWTPGISSRQTVNSLGSTVRSWLTLRWCLWGPAPHSKAPSRGFLALSRLVWRARLCLSPRVRAT